MTAGRGIVHSDRTSPELKARGSRLSGTPTWVALPKAQEETDRPIFRTSKPRVTASGSWLAKSWKDSFAGPDLFQHDLCRCHTRPQRGRTIREKERALYVVSGAAEIAAERFPSGQLMVLRQTSRPPCTTLKGL